MTVLTPMRHRATLRWAALSALIVTLLALTLGTGRAWAHDQLVGVDPEDGSTVAAMPTEIVLTYSGDLIAETGATEIVVTGPDGQNLTSGDPAVSGRTVTQELTADSVETGTVTIDWKVVSGDGHPISGREIFGVGVAPSAAPSASPAAGDPEPGSSAPGAETAILIGVSAAVIVIVLIVVLLLRRPRHKRDARTADSASRTSRDG